MDPDSFQAAGRRLVEWAAEYLSDGERHPVMARVEPGQLRASLPSTAPTLGDSMEAFLMTSNGSCFPV